ncbi:MAG: hypothetical protein JOZ24_05180 [Candidatus Eremiobacteraeota bacterium]|nr:hypothetical protein [Candidatus Eremiobacteraeota bacterium]
MRVPTAEELAAIGAAALALGLRRGDHDPDPQRPPDDARWRLAGRLALDEHADVRRASRGVSRWRAAGQFGD